jgi:hypothetical protein
MVAAFPCLRMDRFRLLALRVKLAFIGDGASGGWQAGRLAPALDPSTRAGWADLVTAVPVSHPCQSGWTTSR